MNEPTRYPNQNETNTYRSGSARHSTMTVAESARLLALGTVAGPVLFTLAWVVLGYLTPGFTIFGTLVEPYSAISQPISGLGLGRYAAFMNTAFVISGLLIIIGAAGWFHSIPEMRPSARWSGAVLLGLSGLGMALDGIFTLEEILPHTLGFLLGTGTPVLGFLVIGLALRRIPRWRRIGSWLLIASPLTLALLILYFATFDPAASGKGLGISGLIQRILVVEVHSWTAALGWLAFRRSELPPGA